MEAATAERISGFFAAPEHRAFALPAVGGGGALLLHGFTGTPHEVRPLGEALAAVGFAARAPLLPGFGEQIARIGEVRGADWLAAARAAWADVAALGEPAVLIGHSMGGSLALHLAATAARPPDRLVLLAPLWRMADRRASLLPLVKPFVRSFGPFQDADFADPDVREVLLWMDPTLNLDDPATVAHLRQTMRLPTAVLDSLRRLALGAGRAARQVHCPTLVLQGWTDTLVRASDTRRLLARIGGPVTYHELPVDHLIPFASRPTWPRVRELVTAFAVGRPARLDWGTESVGVR